MTACHRYYPAEPRLSPRESQITQMLASGMSQKAIGLELGLTKTTVSRTIANARDRLGLYSAAQVAEWARAMARAGA